MAQQVNGLGSGCVLESYTATIITTSPSGLLAPPRTQAAAGWANQQLHKPIQEVTLIALELF